MVDWLYFIQYWHYRRLLYIKRLEIISAFRRAFPIRATRSTWGARSSQTVLIFPPQTLFKWEFIIQMRDAVSQPSLDIEESYFSKNTLFLFKNDFLFYYLKLYIPPVPLIWVFEAFFGPPFCSLTKGKEEKDGSSKVGSRGKSGSVCIAAALIWMINSHLNRTALYHN